METIVLALVMFLYGIKEEIRLKLDIKAESLLFHSL